MKDHFAALLAQHLHIKDADALAKLKAKGAGGSQECRDPRGSRKEHSEVID
jgi:hypothetical protein